MNEDTYINGSIYGHIIGNAIGTSFLQNPSRKPTAALISQLLARDYSYASAMSICTMSSINDFGDIDLEDIANRFYEWYIGAFLPSNKKSRVTISQSIRMFSNGMPPDRCGSYEYPCDNTALIRMLPIALWNVTESTNKIVKDAHVCSSFTNSQIESKVCCALYCLSIKRLLLKEGKISAELEEYYQSNNMNEYINVLNKMKKQCLNNFNGTEEVVDSFSSSTKSFEKNMKSFEDTITSTIKLENDCDNTACISGSLSGASLGLSRIPQRWMNQINLCEEARQVINYFSNMVQNRM